MTLYKYLRPERIDVLEGAQVRFTQPGAVNDPFELRPYFELIMTDDYIVTHLADTQIDVQGALRAAYDGAPAELRNAVSFEHLLELAARSPKTEREFRRTLGEALLIVSKTLREEVEGWRRQFYEGLKTRLGILSLSEVPDSTLMWSHYASDHRGCVLGFDEGHAWFDRRRGPSDEFYHLRRVRYPTERPVHQAMIDMTGEDVFLVKGQEWSYEREWRVLAPLADATSVIEALDGPICLFAFPPAAVSDLIIGDRTEPDLGERLLSLTRNDFRYAHVRLSRATLDDRRGGMQIGRL